MSIITQQFRTYFPETQQALYRLLKGPRRYKNLFKEIKASKAGTIFEVGVWNGKRAVEMIAYAERVTGGPIEYYGIDLFEDLSDEMYAQELSKKPPSKAEVEKFISAKVKSKVFLYKGDTHALLPKLIGELPTMDFIFIDGGHSNETVANDWSLCQGLMGSNTVVIFDDYWRNRTDGGSKLTVDSIDRSKYTVEILPEIDVFNNPDFGNLNISFAKVSLK
jgi:hypothetical protein